MTQGFEHLLLLEEFLGILPCPAKVGICGEGLNLWQMPGGLRGTGEGPCRRKVLHGLGFLLVSGTFFLGFAEF